jgi:hypothetical protein
MSTMIQRNNAAFNNRAMMNRERERMKRSWRRKQKHQLFYFVLLLAGLGSIGWLAWTRCIIWSMPLDPYGYWIFSFTAACH